MVHELYEEKSIRNKKIIIYIHIQYVIVYYKEYYAEFFKNIHTDPNFVNHVSVSIW